MTITRELQTQARDVLDTFGPEVTADAHAALRLQYDLFDEWAKGHDWAMAVFVDATGALPGDTYQWAVVVRVRAEEAGDDMRGGHCFPDGSVHEDTARFLTFACLRDWAGY